MRIDTDLSSPSLELEPVAPFVGPFAGGPFVGAWWQCFGVDDELQVVESDDAAMVVVTDGALVRFAGAAHLTDYHSPLGVGAVDLVREFAESLERGTRMVFDSLPGEAADVVAKGLTDAGLTPERDSHEIAAVLSLPADVDSYFADLGKKQRHEVRRKRRRFAEALGAARLSSAGDEDLDAFFGMHRAASGEKGQFMTDEHESFFRALLDQAGFRLDVLRGDDDRPLAAAVGFDDADAYYLYNSAYDPVVADASPGIVMVAGLIERAIGLGKTRFDFLKGDETYKFRLGAVERPLYVVEAVR
ncbi:MAG: GNAT family N-acetyltransferase [Acidimicrobiia bacterium]|nr:GNAT family N-acetyltransferase [Acidimicrobiia bacterium]